MAEEPYDFEVQHEYSSVGKVSTSSILISIINSAITMSKLFLVAINAIVFMLIIYMVKQQETPAVIDKIIKKKTDNKKRNIAIVIAHPDDEAMFFTPTINSLTSEPDVQVHLLCLSTGNFDGIGKQRTKELAKSCHILGITQNEKEIDEISNHNDIKKSNNKVVIVDHPDLQDGMKNTWKLETISDFVSEFVARYEIEAVSN